MAQEPDTRESKPKQGFRRWEAAIGKSQYSLTIQPARIDWAVSAVRAEWEGEPADLPGYEEAIGDFQSKITVWLGLGSTPSASRLAYGAVLLEPAETRQAGHRELQTYLKVLEIDADNSSDLLYQINRPRDSVSGPAGLKINRLSKWSVGFITRARLVLDAPAIQQSLGPEGYFSRLELDINTDPTLGRPIQQSALGAVFDELVGFAAGIAAKGDIP